MEFVLFWVGFAVVAGVAANARGRSGIGWFFLSLVISPLLSLLLVLVMKRIEPEAASHTYQAAQPQAQTQSQTRARFDATLSTPAQKKCPDCAEMVQAEAKICRFCRHEFPKPEPKPELVGFGLSRGASAVLPGVKTCPACYADNTAEWSICKRCGEKLPDSPEAAQDLKRDCRACGESIPASARVCRHCNALQDAKS
jgi:hypothetical protein